MRTKAGYLFMEQQKRKFEKKSLSINEQLDLLIDRGLIIIDHNIAFHCLSTVGYYRLSAYFKPFLISNNGEKHQFKPKITFDQIWQIYVFDRELRLHVSDALERIEIALRAALSNVLSQRYGNLWYLSKKPFCQKWLTKPHNKNKKKKFSPSQYFIKEINEICDNKKEDFLSHYYKKYDEPPHPPSWMIMECLSFGKCTSLFRNLAELKDKKMISEVFSYHARVVESALEPLRYTRNLCAHHSRLWNRWFVYTPKNLNAFGNFNSEPNSFHMQAFLINKLNEVISPDSKWKDRLFHLFEKYSDHVPFDLMGFQSDWRNDSFWK